MIIYMKMKDNYLEKLKIMLYIQGVISYKSSKMILKFGLKEFKREMKLFKKNDIKKNKYLNKLTI